MNFRVTTEMTATWEIRWMSWSCLFCGEVMMILVGYRKWLFSFYCTVGSSWSFGCPVVLFRITLKSYSLSLLLFVVVVDSTGRECSNAAAAALLLRHQPQQQQSRTYEARTSASHIHITASFPPTSIIHPPIQPLRRTCLAPSPSPSPSSGMNS